MSVCHVREPKVRLGKSSIDVDIAIHRPGTLGAGPS